MPSSCISSSVDSRGTNTNQTDRHARRCPICNLHLQKTIRRYDEIKKAGVSEVVVFHSSKEELMEHQGAFPFPVIGDPTKQLYSMFGIETSIWSILDARMLPVYAEAMWWFIRGVKPPHTGIPISERLSLPAEMLINKQGKIVAIKYGKYAGDQWSVDELLSLAKASKQKRA
jgi:hypothetical protein